MSRSPFADEPGFLSFEDFYLLPIGTEVETVQRGGRCIRRWKRELFKEKAVFTRHDGTVYTDIISGDSPCGRFFGDSGLVPYTNGTWNDSNYTRLPQPKPVTVTIQSDKLTSALNGVIAAVEKVKEIVNE